MSRQINHKKEAFLASVGPWSAGIAVPYAGVSSINPARGSFEGQSIISSPEPYAPAAGIEPAYPVREHSDNTLRTVGVPLCTDSRLPVTAYHIFYGMTRQPQDSCISLFHTPASAALGVPYAGISTPNPEKGSTDSQSEISSPEPYAPLVGILPACRVTTPKNYAPLENGPQSRLHNFRVGAAGPINLRPVFFSKFYPGNLPRPIHFLKAEINVVISSGDCKEVRAAMTFAGVVCIRIGGAALRSGKQCDGKPRRPILSRHQNPNFFQYSLSNPTSREGRINRKNRVGVRRLISSVPVITAETGSTRENRRDSSNTPNQPCVNSLLQPENFAARFRFSCYPKRSSAATCADYTCFPAGSRRQTPFLSLPAPLCGVRSHFPVRRKGASLTQVYFPGRFRAGRRRAQSPMRTVSPGPIFVVSLPKSGSG